jgi:hypothetical protein
MNNQPQQPAPVVLNIKMTVQGLQFAIAAMRKAPIPHEEIDPLIQELLQQGQQEVARVQAEAKDAEEKANAATAELAPAEGA